MRKLAIFCAIALVLALAVPALAEVQNVKVSGSITLRGFFRDNYATSGQGGGRTDLAGSTSNQFTSVDSTDWYQQATILAVDADLTDNVSAVVKIYNESDWQTASASSTISVFNSYVVLKEMLYSPLTVKAGIMPVKVGRGLILGDGSTAPGAALTADEYSAAKAFRTINATLDYDPLTLIVGTVKITEAPATTTDDVDGYLLDGIYKFDTNNAVLDIAYYDIHYNSPVTTSGPDGTSTKGTDIQVIDAVLTGDIMDSLSGYVEFAKQMGDYVSTAATSRDLDAYAFDIGANYKIDAEMSPVIGVAYGIRSGAKAGVTTGDYEAWLPLFEDQNNGEILDPNTNANWIKLSASIKPVEKLAVALDYFIYNLDEKVVTTDGAVRKAKTDLGTEVDLNLKYAYTEDVSLGLLLAMFMPGDSYAEGNDKTAQEAVATMAVKF